jgi:hypothetical protein
MPMMAAGAMEGLTKVWQWTVPDVSSLDWKWAACSCAKP